MQKNLDQLSGMPNYPGTELSRLTVSLWKQSCGSLNANLHFVFFQASRQTISRVADFAEVNQHENKKQVEKLKEQLLRERQNGLLAEKKLRELKTSSLRHTEELAKELDLLKSTSLNSNDSSLLS